VKVDGGLGMTVAPMGGGKSLYEVRRGIAHMLAGGWWVTNVELGVFRDGLFYGGDEAWALKVAQHVAPLSRRNRHLVRDKLLRSYVYTEDLEYALRHAVPRELRRPGHALCRIGWDESLADLNAREWDGGRGKTKDDRAELFERVPMLRKNGAFANLLVQHEELLDKNARRICNWYVRVENQREAARVMGMRLPMLPPLFLAFWYRPNKADKTDRGVRAVKVERFIRGWQANLYDSLGVYGVSKEDAQHERTIWLGRAERPALPEAVRHERPRLPAAEGAA
jgi:hypothetical protein